MKLTEEQKRIALEKLRNFFNTSCDVCLGRAWLLNDVIFEIREFHGGGLVLGGEVFPAITVSCKTCGKTHIFNAILLGLINKN